MTQNPQPPSNTGPGARTAPGGGPLPEKPVGVPATPGAKIKPITIKPPIGDKPGFLWIPNEDGTGLGRVYLVKMRFGREVERIRMTKHFKKFSAKHVRDEVDPLVGDLLFNEREHGALSEPAVREVMRKVQARMNGPRRGPGRGGPPRGPGGPGRGPGGPGGPGGGRPRRSPGPSAGPRPDDPGPRPGGPGGG